MRSFSEFKLVVRVNGTIFLSPLHKNRLESCTIHEAQPIADERQTEIFGVTSALKTFFLTASVPAVNFGV